MLSVGSMIKVNVKSEVRDRVGDIHLIPQEISWHRYIGCHSSCNEIRSYWI